MQNKKDNLIVTVSPHLQSGLSVPKEMYMVIIALLPALIASYFFFGIRSIILCSVGIVTAVVLEALVKILRKKPITVFDGSAIVTGMLLAFNLPSSVPYWIPILGSAVAILIVKEAFGGLGHNIFNPALIGRAFLLAAYPTHMTTWVPTQFNAGIDAATYATPLAILKEKAGTMLPGYWDMFIGNIGGCIGEVSALALIIGGVFLLIKGVISWYIPVSYIGTVAVLTAMTGSDPLFHILSGGLILGAFFMATDMVTSPVTPKGMIIFGIGCGITTVIIRLFGKYPEGVSYSILFMNAVTPVIDRYTSMRRFGN